MSPRHLFFLFQGILLWFLLTGCIATVSFFSHHPQTTDFVRFYISARYFFKGEDMYTPITNQAILLIGGEGQESLKPEQEIGQNLNSPFHTLFLAPFAKYDFPIAFWLWSLFSLACALIAAPMVASQIFRSRSPYLLIGSCLILLAYYPTFINIYLGQFSFVLLLIIALLWILARKGLDFYAGLILAFAISLKIFVAIFVLFFLIRRRYYLVCTAMAVLSCLTLIALISIGSHPFMRYSEILLDLPWIDSNWNASLAGFVTRLNLQSAPPSASTSLLLRAVIVLASLSLIFLLILMARVRPDNSSVQAFDLAFSQTIVTMLLLSPYAWAYYLTLLYIPLLILWHLSAQSANRNRLRFLLLSGWLLSTIPTPFVVTKDLPMHGPLAAYTLAGYYFYSLVVFLILIGYAARTRFYALS